MGVISDPLFNFLYSNEGDDLLQQDSDQPRFPQHQQPSNVEDHVTNSNDAAKVKGQIGNVYLKTTKQNTTSRSTSTWT